VIVAQKEQIDLLKGAAEKVGEQAKKVAEQAAKRLKGEKEKVAEQGGKIAEQTLQVLSLKH